MPALLLVAVAPSPRLSGTCRLFLSLEDEIYSENFLQKMPESIRYLAILGVKYLVVLQ